MVDDAKIIQQSKITGSKQVFGKIKKGQIRDGLAPVNDSMRSYEDYLVQKTCYFARRRDRIRRPPRLVPSIPIAAHSAGSGTAVTER